MQVLHETQQSVSTVLCGAAYGLNRSIVQTVIVVNN
jgi:hypothetical protein